MSTVTRFAPSPTGPLHLGHALSALYASRRAVDANGRFLLRLEDIDPARCRPAFAAAIQHDLGWLGLVWEQPVRRQSEHLAEYAAVLAALTQRGLVYPCFCTRASLRAPEMAEACHAPHDLPPPYPGTCRILPASLRAERIASGMPYALRLDVEAASRVAGPLWLEEDGEGRVPCLPGRLGDVVLGRKDVPASYHLCATHDDAVQGVTLVTRAIDLRPAADLHRLLQALMGWPAPRYAHHGLLRDAAGCRLSKRAGAPPLSALREAGLDPQAVGAMVRAACSSGRVC